MVKIVVTQYLDDEVVWSRNLVRIERRLYEEYLKGNVDEFIETCETLVDEQHKDLYILMRERGVIYDVDIRDVDYSIVD